MYAIVLLQGMVFYGPVATLYRQARGLNVFQITLIESISYILCILFEIPWGMIADRIGYKKSMCICCGLYFVSKLVFWGADGFVGFLTERIMLSIVIAGLSGLDTSILYLSCEAGRSQKVFGIYNSLGGVGLLSASVIFALFVGENYSASAWLTAICYGIAAVLSLFLDEVRGEEKQRLELREIKAVFVRIIKDKRFILFLLSVGLFSQTAQTVTVFLNQIQYENCGMSASAIGFVFVLVTLVGLLGVFSDKLTRILGEKATGVGLYIAAAAACLVLGTTSGAVVSVAAVMSFEIVYSLFQPYQMELQNRQVRSSNRATELSVYAMIVDCISAGTSLVYGALADISLSMSFCFGTLVCSLGLVFFLCWYRKRKTSP